MHDLRSYLGRHQAKPIDAEADKRAGWRKHGILVVAEKIRGSPGPSASWSGSWAPSSTGDDRRPADERAG